MVAMIAFGGTYAYFTATAANPSITDASTALIQLTNENTSVVNSYTNRLPGETLADLKIDLKDSSTRDTYVFATIKVTFGNNNSANAL